MGINNTVSMLQHYRYKKINLTPTFVECINMQDFDQQRNLLFVSKSYFVVIYKNDLKLLNYPFLNIFPCFIYKVELEAKLLTSKSELKQSQLHKEQLEIELSRASKRLQVLEQDARIQDTVCKEHTERLDMCDARRVELEKMTSEFTTTVSTINDLL